MEKLLKGIIEFRQDLLEGYREKFAHLAKGQAPDTLFIACADSRVVPNLFVSTNPGDLFVVRNVGNLVPPHLSNENQIASEAAALEFSLMNLPITNIVVCGHSECGAMQAILSGTDKMQAGSLKSWLQYGCCFEKHAKFADVDSSNLSSHNRLAQMNVLEQIEHLKTYPIVQEKLQKGTLILHGWYFDIASGNVYAFESAQNKFVLIDEVEALQILETMKKK